MINQSPLSTNHNKALYMMISV